MHNLMFSLKVSEHIYFWFLFLSTFIFLEPENVPRIRTCLGTWKCPLNKNMERNMKGSLNKNMYMNLKISLK